LSERRRRAAALGLTLVGGLAACAAPAPVVMQGDANSVQINYVDGDVAPTKAVAARYCAQFERVAHFIQADPDAAFYRCDRW
jgi:hypothetical protein